MFENKLDIFEKRYNELNNKLYDPTVAGEPELYQKVMKEFKEIEPIVDEYKIYKQAKATIEESLEILNESDDKEMRELAEEELSTAKATLAESQQNIKLLLLPKDPNDDRNVTIINETYAEYTDSFKDKSGTLEIIKIDGDEYLIDCSYDELDKSKTQTCLKYLKEFNDVNKFKPIKIEAES